LCGDALYIKLAEDVIAHKHARHEGRGNYNLRSFEALDQVLAFIYRFAALALSCVCSQSGFLISSSAHLLRLRSHN
jgi:hypothetical protein